jgi:beta-carotene hydroxylase
MKKVISRPSIPAELYQPSLLSTTLLIVYSVCLYVIPAWLCCIIATSFDSLLLQIALIVPMTIIAGYGLQSMGFLGHEGFHGSLHRNKMVSALLGLFFASAIITYFDMGAMMRHWSHHRFTNQPSDPDIQMQMPLKTWWQRLLFARVNANLHHFNVTLNTALGRPCPFPYMMHFQLATVRTLCWINFAFALFWIGLYIGVILYDPLAGLFSIALPMVVLLFISGCQSFIDHAGTSDDLFHNAWSRTSPLMTALFAGTNYHLEHHLYPGVPCYRLHKVHKLLRDSGIYDQVKMPIEPFFFGAYRRLASNYIAGSADSSFDPFKPAGQTHHLNKIF